MQPHPSASAQTITVTQTNVTSPTPNPGQIGTYTFSGTYVLPPNTTLVRVEGEIGYYFMMGTQQVWQLVGKKNCNAGGGTFSGSHTVSLRPNYVVNVRLYVTPSTNGNAVANHEKAF